MPISGFGVEDDRLISKALPGLGGVGARVGAKLGGMRGARAGFKLGGGADRLGAKVGLRLKPVKLGEGVQGPAAPHLGQQVGSTLSPRARKAAILGGTAAAGVGTGALLNKSAFGIEDDRIGKARGRAKDDDTPSSGRQAAGALLPGVHGVVAGQRGTKLRAAGNELGGYMGGSIVGSTAGRLVARRNPIAGALAGSYAGAYGGGVLGTRRAHRKGHYKPEH